MTITGSVSSCVLALLLLGRGTDLQAAPPAAPSPDAVQQEISDCLSCHADADLKVAFADETPLKLGTTVELRITPAAR